MWHVTRNNSGKSCWAHKICDTCLSESGCYSCTFYRWLGSLACVVGTYQLVWVARLVSSWLSTCVSKPMISLRASNVWYTIWGSMLLRMKHYVQAFHVSDSILKCSTGKSVGYSTSKSMTRKCDNMLRVGTGMYKKFIWMSSVCDELLVRLKFCKLSLWIYDNT